QLGYVLILVGVSAVGIWAADAYEEATGAHDNQRIVIDEVAGYLLTLLPVARAPFQLVVGFGLFRLFDIWKPWPVAWLDAHAPGGLGVVLDDLAAGVYAALVLYIIDRLDVVRMLSSSLFA